MTTKEEYKGYVTKYHLGELTNEDDIDSIRKIFYENAGSGWLNEDTLLLVNMQNLSDAELLKVHYLKAIVEQNFIMIRQLERISKAVGGEPEPKKPTKMEEYLKAKQESVRNK